MYQARHEVGDVECEGELDHSPRDEVILALTGARYRRADGGPGGLDYDTGQGEAGEAREGQLHRRLHGAPQPGVLVLGEGGNPIEGAVRTSSSDAGSCFGVRGGRTGG